MKHILFMLFIFVSLIFLSMSCKSAVEELVKPPVADYSKVFLQWDFEKEPTGLLGYPSSNIQIVADPLNPANKVMKVNLPEGEYRTEVSPNMRTSSSLNYFHADDSSLETGDEFWLGIKILKPKEDPSGQPVIVQLGPINNPTNNPGVTSAGHYQLQWKSDTDKWRWREFQSTFDPNTTSTDMVTVNYGVWEKFVFHCKFKSNANGLIEVWRNGEKIYTVTRQNGTAKSQTRIVWGVYTGIGNVTHPDFSCYYDDVKIGNRNASYNDVVPK